MRLATDPDQEQSLTYGIVTDALLGVNNFRLFYPHLNFQFDIYVFPSIEHDEVYVGNGQLNAFILTQRTNEAVGPADGLDGISGEATTLNREE